MHVFIYVLLYMSILLRYKSLCLSVSIDMYVCFCACQIVIDKEAYTINTKDRSKKDRSRNVHTSTFRRDRIKSMKFTFNTEKKHEFTSFDAIILGSIRVKI